jgi:hypothetical protein
MHQAYGYRLEPLIPQIFKLKSGVLFIQWLNDSDDLTAGGLYKRGICFKVLLDKERVQSKIIDRHSFPDLDHFLIQDTWFPDIQIK